MPPRKKARVAQKASIPANDEGSIAVDAMETAVPTKKSGYNPLKDPWTDEQEISLFKGIIRWKPAGIHKHFRMIALSEHLRNHGYDPKAESHTRIPGIWEKLKTLYNLEVIDQRENSFDYIEEDVVEKKYLEFSLPEEDFGDMMWVKGRAPSEANSSPSRLNKAAELPETSKKRKRGDAVIASRARASTIEDTDEPKSSPAPPSAVKAGRSFRIGKRSSSRLKGEPSDRQESKDTTADEAEEVAETADVVEVAEAEPEEDDGEDGTPSQRTSKSAAKTAKGGTQIRAHSATRKSTRRK